MPAQFDLRSAMVQSGHQDQEVMPGAGHHICPENRTTLSRCWPEKHLLRLYSVIDKPWIIRGTEPQRGKEGPPSKYFTPEIVM
jgi:hypothetical protein